MVLENCQPVQVNKFNIFFIHLDSKAPFQIQSSIKNMLDKYQLKYNFKNTDVLKICYHFNIKYLCDSIIDCKSFNQKVIYVDLDIKNSLFNEKYVVMLKNLFKKMNSMFPFLILTNEIIQINSIKSNLLDFVADSDYDLEKISKKAKKKVEMNQIYKKIIHFCQKYKLVFLDKEYFNQISVKCSLMS